MDIAAASGVSVTTVSRILNDHPYVAQETRERVLRIMDERGFAPQNAWRQIRSGRSGVIALHDPQGFNAGDRGRTALPRFQLSTAAALGVEEAGYSINIITRTLGDGELTTLFRSKQVDGMILLEIATDDRRPEILRDHGYPFVMVGHRVDNTGLTFVDIDIEHGIQTAIDHLVGLGHRQIGFVTTDPVVGDKTYAYSVFALESYMKACTRLGLPALPCASGLTTAEMSLAVGELLDDHPAITALIGAQTQSVIGVLKLVYARSLQIPQDLSVVAVLNESMGELALPPLTTIDFPTEELGAVAARMMIDRLDHGRTTPEQVFVRPAFTVRGSTGQPRSQPNLQAPLSSR